MKTFLFSNTEKFSNESVSQLNDVVENPLSENRSQTEGREKL